MSSPNFLEASIGSVSMMIPTRYYAVQAGRTQTSPATDTLSSTEIGKISGLIVAGKHNTAEGHHLVSVILYGPGSAGSPQFHIVKNLPVFDGTTVNLVDRENPIYVPSGYRVLTRGFAPDGSDVSIVNANDLPNITCELEVYYVS